MSIALGTAIAYMTLDIKGFKSGMDEVQRSMDTLQSNSAGASDKVQAMGQVFSSMGTVLTQNVTVPLVGLGAQCVKTANEFQSSMLDVQKLSGATGSEFEQLKAKAAEMGEATVFTAKESADAMGYMALAGWKTKDMLAGIEPVLNLAAAAGTDLALTSDIVTDNLTAFGMEAEETTRFVDVMAATMANSNTTVEMLGESFKYCAPIANTLGYSVEDTSLALGLMANSGIKASQAGTTLRKALTSMAAPTDKAAAMMKEYGISLTDSEGKSKTLRQVMIELRETFGGLNIDLVDSEGNLKSYEQLMDEAANSTEKQANMQAIQAANTIFGKTAMSGMLAIINSSEESWDKLAGAIDNSNGATQKMVDTMARGLGYQIEILKSGVEELGRQFGEVLQPMVMAVVKVLQGFFQLLIMIPKPIKVLIAAILMLVAALGPLMVIVGTVILKLPKLKLAVEACMLAFSNFGILIAGAVTNALGYLVVALRFPLVALADLGRYLMMLGGKIIPVVIGAFKSLWAFMLANPITLVIAAIAALGVSLKLLYDNCEWFRDMWDSAWNKILAAFNEVKKELQPQFEELGEQVNKLKSNFEEALDKIGDSFMKLVSNPAFKALMSFIISTALNNAIGLINLLADALAYVTDIAIDALDALNKLFEGDWVGALQGFANIWGNIIGDMQYWFNALIIIVRKGLMDIWLTIQDTISGWPIADIIMDLISGLSGVLGFIQDFVNTVFDVVQAALGGNWEEVKTLLIGYFESLPEHLWGALQWVGDFIGDLFIMIMELLGMAFEGIITFILNWLGQLWESISTWFTEKMTQLGEWFASLPQLIYDALTALGDTIHQWGTELDTWLNELWTMIGESMNTFFWETLPFMLGQALGSILNLFIVEIPKWGQTIWAEVSTWPGKFWEWFMKVDEKVGQWSKEFGDLAKQAGKDFVNWCITEIKALPGRVWDWLVNTWNKAVKWKDDMKQKAKETGQQFVKDCENAIRNLPQTIWNIFFKTEQKADTHKKNMGNKGKSAGKSFGDNLKSAMRGLPSAMANIGEDIVRGLWDGISGLTGWLGRKASTWARNFINGVKDKFKIHSPSRVFRDEIGTMLVRGMAVGMENEWVGLMGMADTMVRDLTRTFNSPMDVGFTDGFNDTEVISRNKTNQFVFQIGKVENNREQDLEELADELAFYINQRV